MYELYYLIDQDGLIDGDKKTIGYFDSIELAHQKAQLDGISHYSIEFKSNVGMMIVFVI